MLWCLSFSMACSFPRKTHRPFNKACQLCLLWLCSLLWFLDMPLPSSVTSSSYKWSCGFWSIPILYSPWGICRGYCSCLEYSSSLEPVASATHPSLRWNVWPQPLLGVVSSPTLEFSLLDSSCFVSLLHSDDFTSLFACYFCVCNSCPFFIGNFICIFFSFSTIHSFGDCMVDDMLIVFFLYIKKAVYFEHF